MNTYWEMVYFDACGPTSCSSGNCDGDQLSVFSYRLSRSQVTRKICPRECHHLLLARLLEHVLVVIRQLCVQHRLCLTPEEDSTYPKLQWKELVNLTMKVDDLTNEKTTLMV